MLNVTNIINLTLLVTFGLACFTGLGWLVVGPLVRKSIVNKKREPILIQEVAQMMLIGLIINYGLVLVFQSLLCSLLISSILSIAGLICLLISFFRSISSESLFHFPVNSIIGAVFISLLFLGPILVRPLFEWDARSIWFFHAKIIYSAGSFGGLLNLQDPSVLFSHLDYPNLMPTLAAQAAFGVGFWNEYLPKISLFYFLVPAVLLLFSFERRIFSFITLITLLLFTLNPWIWNGYMDGYLAIYLALSALQFGRYLQTRQSTDILSGVLCLLALLYLKNEGALGVLPGILTMLGFFIFTKREIPLKEIVKKNLGVLALIFIVLLPFGIWSVYKHQAGFTNDLGIGSANSFVQIAERLKDGSLKIILVNFIEQTEVAFLLIAFLLFTTLVWKRNIPKEIIPGLISMLIYTIGMMLIYLMTPHDLGWQLRTSVNRTMLAVNGCLFIVSYYLLENLEKDVDSPLIH